MKKGFIVGIAVAIVILAAVPVGCTSPAATPTPTPTPDPTIPPHFTTYTDEEKLFSISYPPDWEPALSLLSAVEETTKGLLESLESGLPLEKVSGLFVGGLPAEGRFDPNLSTAVEPSDSSTVEEAAEAQSRGLQALGGKHGQFAEVKAVAGGRKVVIFDHEYTLPDLPRMRYVQMLVLHDKLCWTVTCSTTPEKFPAAEETLNQVVRSFRILR